MIIYIEQWAKLHTMRIMTYRRSITERKKHTEISNSKLCDNEGVSFSVTVLELYVCLWVSRTVQCACETSTLCHHIFFFKSKVGLEKLCR